jgi:hypothetical protein
MNCFDCGTQGIREEAVGTCVSCGAGMCAAHARTEERQLEQHATPGNPVHASTRTLLCSTCDQVMAHHHSLTPVG